MAENGDVYYKVASFEHYGRLSGQDLEDLKLGARIDINDGKQDPMDFALWKAKKEGEPFWESPFGPGRPGWHIECSAMSQKYLGETFDIHGGGQDLKFPHHDNEIAQSEGATGKPFANYWMHNGYINIDGVKMSKSKGNFFTVRDISKEFDLLAVRLFMLSSHYRSPINFSADLLEQSVKALERIDNCRENLRFVAEQGRQAAPSGVELESYRKRFCDAMDDDLNTADAIGVVFELVKELNTAFAEGGDAAEARTLLQGLEELLDVLGLLRAAEEIPQEIIDMANARTEARKAKNWALADQLRDEIKAKGYELKDTPDGVKITKA